MMDVPNGYGRTALIVTMTTAMVGITIRTVICDDRDDDHDDWDDGGDDFVAVDEGGNDDRIMTFVIVMKVAITIRGIVNL